MSWTFWAVEITTGKIFEELALATFSGTRGLLPGSMAATLPLAHMSYVKRKALLDYTVPGKFSIVAMRDSTLMGEWIIWNRERNNDDGPVSLSGSEFVSVLEHRLMPALDFTNIEQLVIARTVMTAGFAGNGGGAIACTIPTPTPSGQLRDRHWVVADGGIGTRLRELSEVLNGFDYLITPSRNVGALDTIVRTATFFYPRAGIDLPYVLEMSSPGRSPGNATSMAMAEDAARLASKTFAIGSTDATNSKPLVGTYTNMQLVTAGYPFYEIAETWSDVVKQATIDRYAQELNSHTQRADSVQAVQVLADDFPTVYDYAVGDRMKVIIEPSINFPDGYSKTIRISSITVGPGASPELVTLAWTEE